MRPVRARRTPKPIITSPPAPPIAEAAGVTAEPVSGGAGDDSPEAVRDQRRGDGDHAEDEQLRRDRTAGGIHELWQDRREEHDALRVGDADDEPVGEDPPAPARYRRVVQQRRDGTPVPNGLYSEVDEVGGSDELEDRECSKGSLDDRADAQRHRDDVQVDAGRVADDGESAGRRPRVSARLTVNRTLGPGIATNTRDTTLKASRRSVGGTVPP